MCDDCENGHPTGGSLPPNARNACVPQLAECLRDSIRAVADFDKLDKMAGEIDRAITELARRAQITEAA